MISEVDVHTPAVDFLLQVAFVLEISEVFATRHALLSHTISPDLLQFSITIRFDPVMIKIGTLKYSWYI